MNRRLLNNIILGTFLAGLQIGCLLFIFHNSKKNTEAMAWQKRYNFSIGYALGRTYLHSDMNGYTDNKTDIDGSFDHFKDEGAKKYDEFILELKMNKRKVEEINNAK